MPRIGVSIPQAVWIACNEIVEAVNLTPHSFNTASGMDCMQFALFAKAGCPRCVSIPQAVWIACNSNSGGSRSAHTRFNTASGMDCMQCQLEPTQQMEASFNTASGMDCMQSHATIAKVCFCQSFNTASGMDCMQ